MDSHCIFCKIVGKEAPADYVYEDKNIVAFQNIKPSAPIHILIVPKRHIESIEALEEEDKELIGELILTAKKVARIKGVADKGYKLVFNVGKGGGQKIAHLHLHLLAGWTSAKERDIPGMP